jgi:hypothetical protein
LVLVFSFGFWVKPNNTEVTTSASRRFFPRSLALCCLPELHPPVHRRRRSPRRPGAAATDPAAGNDDRRRTYCENVGRRRPQLLPLSCLYTSRCRSAHRPVAASCSCSRRSAGTPAADPPGSHYRSPTGRRPAATP